MPSGVADYGAASWLSALFGVTPPITDYYIALLGGEPGPGMDGDMLADLEPVDPAYVRVHYGVGDDLWAANGNLLTTLVDLDFGLPSVDWGFLTNFALCDAPTSGDVYAWGEFLNPQYVAANFQMLLPAGGVVLTLSSLDNSIAV